MDKDFARNVAQFIREAATGGVTLDFNSAYRTPAQQEALGSDPNAITPANLSLHSAGLAVDVNFSSLSNISNGLTGDQQRALIVDAAARSGLSAGINFRTPDPPHFYYDPGTNRADLIGNATESYNRVLRQ